MRNPWLCILIVAFLGLGAVGGTFGLVYLSLNDKDVPGSLVSVMSLCYGSLSSFLVAPPRGSIGIPESKQASQEAGGHQ